VCFFPIAVLILLCGLFINGPYALITTAVSNDLVRKYAHILWHKNNYYCRGKTLNSLDRCSHLKIPFSKLAAVDHKMLQEYEILGSVLFEDSLANSFRSFGIRISFQIYVYGLDNIIICRVHTPYLHRARDES
jgi:hypothetical protein